MKTVVSKKGQVTIPKLLRDRLGIRPDHVLDFHEGAGAFGGHKVYTAGSSGKRLRDSQAALRADEARRAVRVRRAQARAFAACFPVSFLCPCRDYAQ